MNLELKAKSFSINGKRIKMHLSRKEKHCQIVLLHNLYV